MPQPKRKRVAGLRTMAATGERLVCDFCNAPTAGPDLTAFPCADFERRAIVRGERVLSESCTCHAPVTIEPNDVVMTQTVIGAWMACPRCRRAVEAGDRAWLARIAAQAGMLPSPAVPMALVETGGGPELDASLEDVAAATHLAFWLHRVP